MLTADGHALPFGDLADSATVAGVGAGTGAPRAKSDDFIEALSWTCACFKETPT